MLAGRSYAEIYDRFSWDIPEYYNIGVDVCDKWANEKSRLALIYLAPDGKEQRYTFRDLKTRSNQLANALTAHGIEKGDRVGILLPQCPETLIAHIASYKLGGIALPLLTLFGSLAIEYRLANSGATAVITDSGNLPKILEIKEHLPELKLILVVDSAGQPGVLDFWEGACKRAARISTPF